MILENVTYLKTIFIRSISVFTIIVISMTCTYGALKKRCPGPQLTSTFTFTSIESKVLLRQIRQMVTELEYSEAVIDDFITMVNNWENPQGQDVLTTWKIMIVGAQESHRKGRISGTQLAYIEERSIEALAQHIRKEIIFRKDYFDLADIIKDRYANCFGYSQLFYILGNSIDLSVSVMNVTSDHVANIVRLSDGTMIVVDLIKANDFISECIIINNQYDGDKSRWIYKDSDNFVGENKTIHLLDKKELTSEIYYCRGTMQFMSGRSAEAVINYNRAIELDPQNFQAYNNRGGARFILREYSEAITDFNKAINLAPTYVSAYYNRANAYLDSGEYDKAVLDYTSAIKLDSGFAKAYFGRGYAYLALGQYNRSISDYTKAIELNPEYARAYYTRAIGYANLTEYTKAREDMLQAVKLDQTLKKDVEKASAEFELNLRFN